MGFPSLKKLTLWFLLSFFLTALFVCGWLLLALANLPQVDFLADPGATYRVSFPDWEGRQHLFTVGPRNPDWVPLKDIPKNLQNAVLSGEDFSFYSHNGIDWFEVRQSLLKDLSERRFARGASTITQQLAKNLFLSRNKSVKRKVRELLLSRRMEKALTKDRILELYLNVVELGDMVYGVGAGARHHFDKSPSELSLRESTILAAILPGPKVYDPDRNMDRIMSRSDHLLGVMLKGRMITEDQYLAALVKIPFSEEPPDLVDTEPGLESFEGRAPMIEETPEAKEDEFQTIIESDMKSGEMLTTINGIVEIPVKRWEGVNGEP